MNGETKPLDLLRNHLKESYGLYNISDFELQGIVNVCTKVIVMQDYFHSQEEDLVESKLQADNNNY